MAMFNQIGHINFVSQLTCYAYQVTYIPIYLPSTYSCPPYLLLSTYYLSKLHIYLLTYLLYLFIYLLIIYLLIYLSTYYLPTYLPIVYINRYVHFKIGRQAFTCLPRQEPTNLLMKKIEVQMLLYKLIKNFMKVQRNILNAFGIILFYKMTGWFYD